MDRFRRIENAIIVLEVRETMKPIDRKDACTFTGHRPEKLKFSEIGTREWLEFEIRTAIIDGYTTFITGMQRGVDIWAAEIVLRLRSEGEQIRLIAACAFRGMEERWDTEWHERYRSILLSANGVYYIGERPGTASFLKRDRWMVDHASRLIAVYCGVPGGTRETIEYAKAEGIEVVVTEKGSSTCQ